MPENFTRPHFVMPTIFMVNVRLRVCVLMKYFGFQLLFDFGCQCFWNEFSCSLSGGWIKYAAIPFKLLSDLSHFTHRTCLMCCILETEWQMGQTNRFNNVKYIPYKGLTVWKLATFEIVLSDIFHSSHKGWWNLDSHLVVSVALRALDSCLTIDLKNNNNVWKTKV